MTVDLARLKVVPPEGDSGREDDLIELAPELLENHWFETDNFGLPFPYFFVMRYVRWVIGQDLVPPA